MKADRWIALAILAFSIAYGWLAWHYPLLPFELNQPFKPNTMPVGLAVIAMVLSLAVLVLPARSDATVTDESTFDGPDEDKKQYDKVRPVILIGLMIAYALCLRPLGFVGSTTLFIALAAMVLGERKFHILLPVAVISAFAIWYLVQQVLGIFLTPWPVFMGPAS